VVPVFHLQELKNIERMFHCYVYVDINTRRSRFAGLVRCGPESGLNAMAGPNHPRRRPRYFSTKRGVQQPCRIVSGHRRLCL
jgi:hypothetical protein